MVWRHLEVVGEIAQRLVLMAVNMEAVGNCTKTGVLSKIPVHKLIRGLKKTECSARKKMQHIIFKGFRQKHYFF